MKPYEQKTYNELLEFITSHWTVFGKSGVPPEGLAKAALKQVLATGDEAVVWNALYRKAGVPSNKDKQKEHKAQLKTEIETTLRSLGTSEDDIPGFVERLLKKCETQGVDKVRLMLTKMTEKSSKVSQSAEGKEADQDKKLVLYRHLTFSMGGNELWTVMPTISDHLEMRCVIEKALTEESFNTRITDFFKAGKVEDPEKRAEVALKMFKKDRARTLEALQKKYDNKINFVDAIETKIVSVLESEEDGFEVVLDKPHGFAVDDELKLSCRDGCGTLLATKEDMPLEKRHRQYFVKNDLKRRTAKRAEEVKQEQQEEAPPQAKTSLTRQPSALKAAAERQEEDDNKAAAAAAADSEEKEGTQKEVSNKLQNVLVKCQPFKDHVATIICRKCFALMAFPSSATRVRCSSCKTITAGVRVDCLSCHKTLSILLSVDTTVCPHCNFKFTKMSAFQLRLPKHVKAVREVTAEAVGKVKVQSSIKAIFSPPFCYFDEAEAAAP